ncbi:hypothetical protein [Rathayibacter sp. AY1E6]|uniref:hypothetical protein n=1 Tax=Rathayibacter sp. AY1E6 TaxID=2080554 RepID=UPI000CE7C485|nr:hypothetical protein [Rathayibacter sp. AY1E6]PPF72093.1 hypothetical protein C5C46_07400 [Rathayibacter sp. AY1E6]
MILTPALAAERYADWVVDLIPGARGLHDAYLETLPEVETARVKVGDTIRSANALRGTDVHPYDLDEANRQKLAAQRDHDRATRTADRALAAFKAAVDGGRGSQSLRKEAARRALATRARAIAALSELEATVDMVDLYWQMSGSPGRSWHATATSESESDYTRALAMFKSRLSGLDVAPITAVGEGEDVPHELHGEALRRSLQRTSASVVRS